MKEIWSPVEPHSIGLDSEFERKITQITDFTICEQTKPSFWDFENILPQRRSNTEFLAVEDFGQYVLDETFPLP